MSVSDFGLVFSIILCICIFFHCIHYNDFQTVQFLQVQYNLAVDQAVEAALYDAVESDTQSTLYMNEGEVIENFFQALFVNLGIEEEPMKKELCKFYVPYILFVEKDGIIPFIQTNSQTNEVVSFQDGKKVLYEWEGAYGDVLQVTLDDYVRYYDEAENERVEGYYKDVTEYLPEWFQWELNEFRERKKTLIIELIEQCTNECIQNQNQIAKRFGIRYQFTLPKIEYEEWYRTIQDVSMIVLFQGYPYGNGVTGRFNRVAIGAARIKKAEPESSA